MTKKHFAAVVGGATAGSEVTSQLTKAGVEVVILEQNPLPYGKIEDGLPRWHSKLRQKEYEKIDEKITHELVHYVPYHKLGVDFTLEDLQKMGFSIIILANGAWKDRPMAAEGLELVCDDSFCYQNPFIFWFNHYPDKNYNWKRFPVKEGAVVIGGGLASIDVIKTCQLEITKNCLRERGITVDVLEMEHKGIPNTLEQHGLQWADLGIKPARLYYRRRIADMPLASPPENATPEKMEKIYKVREKIIQNAVENFCFEVYPLHLPKKIHTRNGTVSGITFGKTKVEGGKVIATSEEVQVETQFVVSSIGSIPEPLSGISMKGETYELVSEDTGQFKQYPNVFGVGNAITGKGNIQVSMKHGRYIGQMLAGSLTATGPDYEALLSDQEERVQEQMKKIRETLSSLEGVSEEKSKELRRKIKAMQEKKNFPGDYKTWKEKILSQR